MHPAFSRVGGGGICGRDPGPCLPDPTRRVAPGRRRLPALPAAVRWLPRGRVPQDPDADWYDVPPAAAGAVAFRFGEALDGELRAVSLEALDGNGRQRATRWRRTYGEKKGAAFVLRPGIAARRPPWC